MTRKFRKMISLIVAMAVLLSATMVPSVAFGDSVSIRTSPERTIADAVLAGFGDYQYLGSTELKNLNGESEAVCFRYAPDAYVIVNHNDLSVPEYSPSNPSPFDAEGATEYIYNGPLAHFYKDSSNSIRDVSTDGLVDSSKVGLVYSKTAVSVTEKNALVRKAQVAPMRAIYKFTQNLPETWVSSYATPLHASSILLRYIYVHHNTNVLYPTYSTNNKLQEYLSGVYYVPNTNINSWQLLGGCNYAGITYKGLNKYLSDRNVSTRGTAYSFTNTMWSDIQSSFVADYPVLVQTSNYHSSSWSYGSKTLVAYGYYYQDTSGGSLVVNDGQGHNNIHLTTDLNYYWSVVLFN